MEFQKGAISSVIHPSSFILTLACPIALIWTVQHDPFFWDTVQLASKHAHHFYENSLRWTPLPAEIDSGHPPVFGLYLACAWTFFGKTLPVSHWAMLPFLLGIVALLHRLGQQFSLSLSPYWLLPLVLLDPVLAGQLTLVSPDVVLAFFFLLAIDSILGRRALLLAISILGLCAISMRGMMTAGALFLWTLALRNAEWRIRNAEYGAQSGLFRIPYSAFRIPYSAFRIPHSALAFIPGFIFAAWFLWWHWQATGWIGYHPGSAWAPAFERAQGWEILRNLAVVAWRWLDFGRVFEWTLMALILRKFWLSKNNFQFYKRSSLFIPWLLLLICLLLLLTPSAVMCRNLSAHRYFLPGFLVLHLLVFQWISIVKWSNRKKEWLLTALIAGMATGNLWVYPAGISMDWDSTLAHQPYHRLRAEALAFLDKERVDFQAVGSAFPNLNTGENLLLNGDPRHFAELDWERNTYVLASNIFNDLSAADHERLRRDWNLQFRQVHAGVWVEIYRRR